MAATPQESARRAWPERARRWAAGKRQLIEGVIGQLKDFFCLERHRAKTLGGRYNLQARGPANWPKDGASPLEGIVETDWLESTFTMNWKLTRANLPVVFEADEPICMIVPRRRGELEAFEPEICEIGEEPALAEAYERWADSRGKFNRELEVAESEAQKRGWQKDYVRGMTLGGVQAKEHQTKLKLKDFAEQG